MSLQIWLPLINNCQNQGLMECNVQDSSEITATFINGKMGQCLNSEEEEFNFDIPDLQSIIGPQRSWSIACWIKFKRTTGSGYLMTLDLAAQHAMYFNLGSDPRLVWNESGDNGKRILTLDLNDIATRWYHVVVTLNKDIDNSIIETTYIDGLQTYQKTWVSTKQQDVTYSKLRLFSTNGYFNDIRIYNHCLSQKEVEEISKGLILHYKLDNNGYNNLLTSTVSRTVTVPEGDTDAYTAYWYFNTDIKNNHLFENNPRYTVIYDYTVNNLSESSTSAYLYSQLNTSRSNPVISQTGFRTNINGHVIESFTVDNTQKAYSSTFRFRIRLQTANPGDSVTISNLRIYLCDKNEINYISDSSGYNNNGNIIGYLLNNEDSIKYNSSLFQDNGLVNYIRTKEKIYVPTDAITMNIWIKSTNTTPKGNYHDPFCAYTTPASFEMSIYKTGYLRGGFHISGTRVCDNCTSLKLLDGNWHMITITYDGIAIKKYVDAILEKTTAATGTLTSPMDFAFGRYGSGTTYSSNDMAYSDARIYATALTELQIKELYHTSMSIDNNGNIYTRELVE